jgi:RimJ/RimL family protein N-acetyltransferase
MLSRYCFIGVLLRLTADTAGRLRAGLSTPTRTGSKQIDSATRLGHNFSVPELQRLCAGHADAVLAFERANREWFAASVSDRGDEFFARFADRFAALLADQEAGGGAYYVVVDPDGSVLGRFNLIMDGQGGPGVAELGYRVARHAAGRGLATATVRELAGLAASRHGVHTLRAATASGNVASQRVLIKAGFVPAGPADPAGLGGKPGTWYQRAAGEDPAAGRSGQ